VTFDGRSDRSIPPGQTDEIKISISTKGRTGDFERKITGDTNDANQRAITLTLKGRAKVAFKADPTFINFGTIVRNAPSQKKTLVLTRGDGGPLAPEVVPSKNAPFAAVLREVTPGERYEADVTLNPPWPNDRIYGQLTVRSGVPDAPPQDIQVSAQIEPRLKALPMRFEIPRNLAQATELRSTLVWSGENPGKAVGVTPSDPALSARIEEANGRQSVVLSVPAGFDQKVTGGPFVQVGTDDKEAPNLRIQITLQPGRPPSARPPGVPGPSGITPPAVPGGVGPPAPATQPAVTPRPRVPTIQPRGTPQPQASSTQPTPIVRPTRTPPAP
jgi:hypothetical protein